MSLLMTACLMRESNQTVEGTSSLSSTVTASSTLERTDILAPTLTMIQPATPMVGPMLTSIPVVSIATGLTHSLALQENGNILAWGAAESLGLSQDRNAVQPTPILLENIEDIKEIDAYDLYSLFINDAGEISEIGYIERGKYDKLPGLDQVRQVATGYTGMLALKEDGTVWAWGEGQIAPAGRTDSAEFIKVPVEDVVQIAFARNLALAVKRDGTVWAWGGERLVTGMEEIWTTPRQVQELQNVECVAWGDGLNILHTDGTVTVWTNGEFFSVKQLPPITQLDGDDIFYNFGVATDGTLWVWGTGWPNAVYSELDQMPYSSTMGPERFQGHQIDLHNVVQISAEGGTILVLDEDGTVWAWGVSSFGELGTGLVDGALRVPTPIIIKK
jgi:alpha-tubulin suppressor-like RCC1 family protein